ncbi:predicted protein, partial [Nematostella vectensis]
ITAIKVTCYVTLMILSLIGNCLVLSIICRNRQMHTTTNYFIANMACSDLIIPIFVAPTNIIDILSGTNRIWLVKGTTGLVLCKVMYFLLDVSTAVSIQSLVAMAIDRYYAVSHPLKANQSARARALVIPLTWVIAAAVHAPHLYTFRLYEINSQLFCYSSWEPAFENVSTTKRYQMSLFTLLYVLSLLLITALYARTLHLLRNRIIPGDVLPEQRMREDATTRGILKMTVTVVAAFALSWLPVHVLILLLFYDWDWLIPCHMRGAWFAAFFFGYAYSVLNPCVYFLFNKNYRASFKALWESLCC